MGPIEERPELIEEVRSCPFCGGTAGRPLRRLGLLRIVRCEGCGLLHADRRWNARGLELYYDEGYFTGQVPGAHRDYLAEEQEKLADFEDKYRALARWAGGGRLLDVGCATGFSLTAAARLGYQPEGVELSAWAAAQNRSGCPIHQCGLLELEAEARFDLLSLWDVIEHLLQPEQTFARLNQLLRPGGLLALTTPDPTSLSARLLGSRWTVLSPAEHYLICPPPVLRSWLARHGFAHLADLPERRVFTAGKLAEKVFPRARPLLERAGLARRLLALRVPYKRLSVFRKVREAGA